MNIKSFEYTDHAVKWVLEPIEFSSLTLLVGASGVGKTRILKSLLHLKKIACGTSLNGLQWKIKFSITNDDIYEWSGSFENKGFLSESMFDNDDDDKNKPNIESEKLYINDNLVIDRNQGGIIFNGAKTVKLSQKESVINLLKEEEQIKDVHTEFSQMLFDDISSKEEPGILKLIFDNESEAMRSKYGDLNSIRNSDESLKTKLYLIYLNVPNKFEEIKNSFIDVFSYVEELKIEPVENTGDNIPRIFKEIPFIQIKEHGIQNWIDERKLSSGMYRTLMHIAELHLCADGTIILIDEFENSLGINCIDEITRSIVTYKRDLQFIITSHHPYIINNISTANWKLITRKAGIVKNYNASQFKIGRSKHEAFTQLINLDEYLEGVES
ncbi:AAA family ATPase [Candidatus Parabeggiatoa sp. HSG14]|uniref:AAA family ATPase n=1 Tax=Candidatus Parabeggiatoa sp. HSG14 TaxID=3055593 RepID=UPI0025A7224B|nr:AAA family ATPase [Thiotrichales bacterium HSG14]